jgi:hypothetical protein
MQMITLKDLPAELQATIASFLLTTKDRYANATLLAAAGRQALRPLWPPPTPAGHAPRGAYMQ